MAASGSGWRTSSTTRRRHGKVVYRTKNDDLLMSYWSLVFDYSKGIVCLLANKFHSPAFALMRPLVEAVTREHIVLVG